MTLILKKLFIIFVILMLSVSVLFCFYDSTVSMNHNNMHSHENNIPVHIEHATLLTLATIPAIFIISILLVIFILIKYFEIFSDNLIIQNIFRFYNDEYILKKQEVLFRYSSNPRAPPQFI